MAGTTLFNYSSKLDETFFEELLREILKDNDIVILEVAEKCISAKCMNFLSDLFKIALKYKSNATTGNDKNGYEQHSIDLVVKIEPYRSATSMMLMREQNLFTTELVVLRDILPAIENLLGQQIGPKCYYGSDDPRVLIMEDLECRGFAMKDRQKGLSIGHCFYVIEQLARFHAGSVALHEKNAEMIESFKGGILSKKCPESYVRMMEVSLSNIAGRLRSWSEKRYQLAAEKLEKLAGTIKQRSARIYEYESNEFCVLNHGDCWINNLMFREDECGKPYELLMLDYQMAVYTSPAIDLLYFMNICPEITWKYEADDLFLNTYLYVLSCTMQRIGCKTRPPTYTELKRSMYERRIYAVFAGLILHLRMISNEEDTEDFEEVLNELSGNTKMDVLKNPQAKMSAQKMIPRLDERGYLD